MYSPQYSLWLLPWFALTMPNLRRFVAFEITDVAVFVTRFWFFGTYTGVMVLPQQWWFELALAARAAVLDLVPDRMGPPTNGAGLAHERDGANADPGRGDMNPDVRVRDGWREALWAFLGARAPPDRRSR